MDHARHDLFSMVPFNGKRLLHVRSGTASIKNDKEENDRD